jgi:hypothetical protein
MQADKKQLEILLVQYFRESFSAFPKGVLNSSESPDFIVTLKNRHQLGIELTRLHSSNHVYPDPAFQDENLLYDRLVATVQELVEKDLPHRMFVKFLFSATHELRTESEMITAAYMANVIRKEASLKHHHSFFRFNIPASRLPEGIEDVLVVNHPALLTPVWERANRLGVSDNVVDDLLQSILKKEEKLRLYQKQKLNYYWLLIFTDRLRGVRNFNLPNKLHNHQFESRFQHVYLFDLMKSHIFELV